jgi:hypothetical protein
MHHRASIGQSHTSCSTSKIEAIPNPNKMPSPTHLEPLGPPPPTGQYAGLAEIKALLQAYARDNGYAIVVDCSTPKKAAWVCSKSGKYNDKNKAQDVHQTKRRRNTATTKTSCPFRVQATFDEVTDAWTTNITSSDYNHDVVVALSALLHHRLAAITPKERLKVSNIAQLGHSPSAILNAL